MIKFALNNNFQNDKQTILTKILLLAIVTSFFLGCGHKGDKNDPLYKKVMTIHDEVMPKLSAIHKLKKKLQNEEVDSLTLPLISALDKADEGMMIWMSEFDPPSDQPQRKEYLTKELISVQVMADKINNSIAEAEKHLKLSNQTVK